MRYLRLCCLSASLWGQTFDLSHSPNGSASLAGQWKFHAGDDLRRKDAIARSAQQFGQEDDITVISISRQAVRTMVQAQAASISVPSSISS